MKTGIAVQFFVTTVSLLTSAQWSEALTNDQCSSATIIQGFTYTNVISTTNATSTGDPQPSCVGQFGNGIWYRYQPIANGQLTLDTFGSDFDTGIGVYAGSCGALIEIACDDDGGPQLTSSVSLPVLRGTNYYILIGGFLGHTGNLAFHLVHNFSGPSIANPAMDTGSYDSTGYHDAADPSYLVGESSLDANEHRNWFVFPTPVTSGAVVQAELLIYSQTNSSPSGSVRYLLRQVSTPVAQLVAGGSGLTNIFNDLCDGAVYGVRDISSAESGQVLIVPLNPNLMNAVGSARGLPVAVGGSIPFLDGAPGNEFVFGTNAGAVQLRLTFGTVELTNASASGWYDVSNHNVPLNRNYFVGRSSNNLLHNFFIFNVPGSGYPLLSAYLLVKAYNISSLEGFENYQLHDVSTPLTKLANGGSGLTNIFDDLGTGTLYGGRDVYVNESNLVVNVPLNSAFVSAAINAAGRAIAVGGSIESLSTNSGTEGLFVSSGLSSTDVQLWLGFAPTNPTPSAFIPGATRWVTGNGFQSVVAGIPGSSYEVQGSFDMLNWDVITNLTLVSSNCCWNDPIVISSQRFYRVKWLP